MLNDVSDLLVVYFAACNIQPAMDCDLNQERAYSHGFFRGGVRRAFDLLHIIICVVAIFGHGFCHGGNVRVLTDLGGGT